MLIVAFATMNILAMSVKYQFATDIRPTMLEFVPITMALVQELQRACVMKDTLEVNVRSQCAMASQQISYKFVIMAMALA